VRGGVQIGRRREGHVGAGRVGGRADRRGGGGGGASDVGAHRRQLVGRTERARDRVAVRQRLARACDSGRRLGAHAVGVRPHDRRGPGRRRRRASGNRRTDRRAGSSSVTRSAPPSATRAAGPAHRPAAAAAVRPGGPPSGPRRRAAAPADPTRTRSGRQGDRGHACSVPRTSYLSDDTTSRAPISFPRGFVSTGSSRSAAVSPGVTGPSKMAAAPQAAASASAPPTSPSSSWPSTRPAP
jgi:hypothetical protein